MKLKVPKAPDNIAILLIVLLSLPVLYFSLLVPFETDTGDSVVHYFFARYAFQDPRLFLDHWAKPFFTLLASPFAQFGFAGMKLFNGLAGVLSAWFAYCIAKKLDLKFPWLAIILVLFAPDYFVKLFSGYTEPLFGLILIASVYLVIIRRPLSAALLLSFLPFVRSEGLIIILVFAFCFLIRKNYKAILLLTSGHVVYSLAGLLSGKSIMWVFTEIPYQVVSNYGKGNFTHYPVQLLLTVGVPIFLLSMAGMVVLFLDMAFPKIQANPTFKTEVRVLILGSFLAYFLFHIFSWGFGLFGSMGLSRVLTAVVPLLALIALIGLNFLTSWESKGKFPLHTLVYFPILGYVLLFPFLHNPASIDREKDLCRSPDMNLMQNMADDIKKRYPNKLLYYSNPYLSFSLNINPFDKSKHLCFTDWQSEGKLNPNSIIIWDSWFSVVEERTDSISMLRNPELHLLKRYETNGAESKSIFLVFGN